MTAEALKRTADRRLDRINELETAARAMLAALKEVRQFTVPYGTPIVDAAIAQAEAAGIKAKG